MEINWYTETGKWKYSTDIPAPDYYCSGPDLKQYIVDKQQELKDSWTEENFFVTVTTQGDEPFCDRLFQPGEFDGYARRQS